MPDSQIHKFIFAPVFSTAAKVTSVSGRGVGMDVVRNNIDQIGGTIDVKSIAGVGLSFSIKIPLTLAIVAALIVEAGGERFAIPQLAVIELVRVRAGSEHRVERIKDTAVLRLRDKLLPLARLSRLLGSDTDADDVESGFIVVTEVGSQSFGIVVDGVFHTEEIVVKPMSSKLRHIGLFSGNTILGDGSVIMIIDPNGIAQSFGSEVTSQLVSKGSADGAKVVSNEQKTPLLVFRAGSAQTKAVPLALITRLEEVDAHKIELSNGRHMVQYRGQLMPLVSMNESVRVKGEGSQPLLVFSDGARSMALVVDEIVDIVEDRLDIQVGSGNPGVLGSAIIKGQATEIIDVGHFLPLAFEDWFRRKELPVRSRPHSVLLIDDSPFFRNMLTPVLQAAGYEVTAAMSAPGALMMLKEGRTFDVVITDIEMPEMDGFEFAKNLRSDPRTADLPLIALSSVVSAEAVERSREVGFHDYVAKFDRQGLIAALKEQTDVGRAA
jgi:two-component system, chemotaxis family, sensor kinase CheA